MNEQEMARTLGSFDYRNERRYSKFYICMKMVSNKTLYLIT